MRGITVPITTANNEIFFRMTEAILKETLARDIDPTTIAAIIYVETVRGYPFLEEAVAAQRMESGFYSLYIRNKKLTGYVPKRYHGDTERYNRAQSWGLMQIMGATAREHGFEGQFFPQLCNIETNIYVGCRYFSWLLNREHGDYDRAVRRYNGSLLNPATKKYLELHHEARKSNFVKSVMSTINTRRVRL